MFKISVIIATYNRNKLLKKCLESLLDQDASGAFSYEVIVVDNNSTDGTRTVVENFMSGSNGRFKYLKESVRGKSFALNRGVKEADGDIIAFTDDDVVAEKKWLASLARCFTETGCDGVGGRVLPIYPEQTPEWIRNNKEKMSGVVVACDNGNRTEKFHNGMYEFIGANYAFRRKVFDGVGLFRTDIGPGLPDPTTGEDREFVDRILNNNMNVFYCGQALVWHPIHMERMKLKNMAEWNIALGRNAARREKEITAESFNYSFGVPRYLIKGIIQDFFGILLSLFSRKALFLSFRKFFRKAGMIMEYRSARSRKS